MNTPSRCRNALPAVISILAAWPCAAQPSGIPTTAKEILLTTKTPLGEAAIVRPAGSEVTEPIGNDQEIVLRQGPFTARISRADLVFPAPPPAASPGPPEEAAEESQTVPGSAFTNSRWQEEWRILIPTGAALLLGIYSLIVTVALVRQPRRWED